MRDLRVQRGLTQEAVAEVAGVKRAWVNGLESGDIQRPGAEKLGPIADALDVTVEYLLTGRIWAGDAPVFVAAGDRHLVEQFARLPRWSKELALRLLEAVGTVVQPFPADAKQPPAAAEHHVDSNDGSHA
jgi:transcriptional regulator with XRE-family HTH domain